MPGLCYQCLPRERSVQKELQVPRGVECPAGRAKVHGAWAKGTEGHLPYPSWPLGQCVEEAGLAGDPLSWIPDESEPQPRDLSASPEAGDLGDRKEAPGLGGWALGWDSGAREFPGRGPAEAGHADEPLGESVLRLRSVTWKPCPYMCH